MSNHIIVLAVVEFVADEVILCYCTRTVIFDRDLYRKGLLSVRENEKLSDTLTSEEKERGNNYIKERCFEICSENILTVKVANNEFASDVTGLTSDGYLSCEEDNTYSGCENRFTEEEEMLRLGLPVQFGHVQKKRYKGKRKKSKNERYQCEKSVASTSGTVDQDDSEWQLYWSTNGETLIWQSWVEKYKDYINPTYLNSSDVKEENASSELNFHLSENNINLTSSVITCNEQETDKLNEYLDNERCTEDSWKELWDIHCKETYQCQYEHFIALCESGITCNNTVPTYEIGDVDDSVPVSESGIMYNNILADECVNIAQGKLEELQLTTDNKPQDGIDTSNKKTRHSEQNSNSSNSSGETNFFSLTSQQTSSFSSSDGGGDEDDEPPEEIPIRRKRSHEIEADDESNVKKLKML